MTIPLTTSKALFIVPDSARTLAGERLDAGLRRWLGSARWRRTGGGELLQRAVSAIGLAPPSQGLGALRLWGDAGERPEGWVCAADPVHLEARLRDLGLRTLPAQELEEGEVADIFEHLQSMLGEAGNCRFSRHGRRGYLHRGQPMQTASASPAIAAGNSPGDFLPAGATAGAHDRLQSEVQMSLHQAATNLRRAEAGLLPVNSLWFWGGGTAPVATQETLPALFADDPLFRGYWRSAGADPHGLPEDPDRPAYALSGDFVAVLPESSRPGMDPGLPAWLGFARRSLRGGTLSRVTLLFGDGALAECGRWDRLRFWRTPDRTFRISGQ